VTISRLCAACADPLPDTARFCPGCGRRADGELSTTALDEEISHALAVELRNLTVVFCDLVGSTELSSTTDAEEYSDLIQAYQQQAVTIARRLGGDVEGYSGDGILFRFGWPQAHEDDASRALATALEILDSLQRAEETRGLAVRVGVHSGPAVVGQLGGADRRATMAVGETLNVSARLQGIADPGSVVASSATIELVGDRFVTTPLGPVELRGVPDPVTAFRVHGLRAVPSGPAAPVDRTSPLVGRAQELEFLESTWRTVREGSGCGVLLTGEPGVGKSRLTEHVRDRVRDDGPLWLQTSCSPHTRMSVLRPIVDLIEEELALDQNADTSWRMDQVRTSFQQAGSDVPDDYEFVTAMLGIPTERVDSLGSELRLERTIAAGVAWIVALSRRHPLVLCIEDLQWCDPTTLDAIERLIDQIADVPVLVLLTARTGFGHRWSSPSAISMLELEPLADDDVRTLAGALGVDARLPEQVLDRIVACAGGIPLYVEEVGRTVLESDLLVRQGDDWNLRSSPVTLDVPGTLQASLLARLDRLGPAKAVAQLASVVGGTFSFDLLAAVSGMQPDLLGRLLERLVGSGLILHDPGHDATYAFKHALVQEATYDSLLRRNRRTIHERVARVLDAGLASGASTAPEVVAWHYEAADLAYEAAGYYQLAARVAADRSGHREAVAFLRRAIELVGRSGDGDRERELEVELQLSLGSALAARSYADPELAAAYERARELCEGLGNDERVGLSLGGLSIYYLNRGDIALGAELAERVLAIAEARADHMLAVLGGVQLSLARSWQGRPRESLDHATRALVVYRPERHRVLGDRFGTDQGVAAHVFAGWSHLLLGHLDRGLAHLVDAVELADAIGHPFNQVYAQAFLATGHCERGESTETLRWAERARRLAEEQGFSFWAGIGGVWEATERVATGDHAALDEVLQAGFTAGGSGSLGGGTNVLARMAEAARAAGDHEMTAGLLETALTISEQTGQPWWDSALHRQVAELHFDQASAGDASSLTDPRHPWSKAADSWTRSLASAEQMALPLHGARAAAGYGNLLHRIGKPDEGRRLLATWYGRCAEGRATPVLATIRSQLESLGDRPA
jgi:class 3 adenylate cyclase/tetratricopeptide (TPR) repeat protein